jgi:hypothetical protein
MTRRLARLKGVPAACVVIAIGSVMTASVAYAATLSVTSSRITTSSVAVSIAASTCTLVASGDAALDRSSQNSNLGSYSLLSVRSQSGNNMRRSLVRFDLGSCNIPATAVVRSASLNLVVTTPPGSTRNYGVHRVTGSWNESTVTYSSQPAFIGTASSTIATGASPSSLSWSVVSDVNSFVKGTATNNGWLVKDVTEASSPSVETLFGSRENSAASNRPTLVIGYYP